MTFDSILAGACAALSATLALFGLHRAWLLARFRWPRRAEIPELAAGEFPSLTVQLPLFDERRVAARLIRAVGELDYPRERFEVQVLDDSTDSTREIVDRELARLRERGIDAVVLRRGTRAGFKAGALAAGLREARGELIAVFDADFVPPRDFLTRLAGAFRDPAIDMVQARWEHLNRDESLLTRAQATLLDGHFVVTHKVHFDEDLLFHFNGTAGIWRRSAIGAAGGWQHDTLTEDLDLSYRAQLAGSRFVYAAHVTAPAELPAGIGAFQSQQARWARGSVQVARKLAGEIVRSRLRPHAKLEALMHFAAHAGHPLVLALGVVLPLALARPSHAAPFWFAGTLLASALAVALFFAESQRALGRPFVRRWVDTLAALALGMGMSVVLTRAALAGMGANVGSFVRTPKRGENAGERAYRPAKRAGPWAEIALAGWSVYGIEVAVRTGAWGALPFLALHGVGLAWVAALTLRDGIADRRESELERACSARSTASEPSS